MKSPVHIFTCLWLASCKGAIRLVCLIIIINILKCSDQRGSIKVIGTVIHVAGIYNCMLLVVHALTTINSVPNIPANGSTIPLN